MTKVSLNTLRECIWAQTNLSLLYPCLDPPIWPCFIVIWGIFSTSGNRGRPSYFHANKHLSRWGVRVNLREGERKRKLSGGDDDDDDEEEDDRDNEDGGDGPAGSKGSGSKGGRGGRGGGKSKGSAKSLQLSKATVGSESQPSNPPYTQFSQHPQFASVSGGSTAVSSSRPATSDPAESPNRRTGSETREDDPARDPFAPREGPQSRTDWVQPVNWSRAPVTAAADGWNRPPGQSQGQHQHQQQPAIGDWSRRPEKHYIEASSPGGGQQPQEAVSETDQTRKRFKMTQGGYESDLSGVPSAAIVARPVDVVVDMSVSPTTRLIPPPAHVPTSHASATTHPLALDLPSPYMAHAHVHPPPSYSAPSFTPPPGLSPAQRYASTTSYAPPATIPPPTGMPPTSGLLPVHSTARMHQTAPYAVAAQNAPFGYRGSR